MPVRGGEGGGGGKTGGKRGLGGHRNYSQKKVGRSGNSLLGPFQFCIMDLCNSYRRLAEHKQGGSRQDMLNTLQHTASIATSGKSSSP